MSRELRSVEITDNRLVINGLDITSMITKAEITLADDSFPVVTIHSRPDVLSFKGTALVDDPRLDANVLGIPRTVPIEMLDGIGLPPVDVSDLCLNLGPGFRSTKPLDGIERLRRRQADAWGLRQRLAVQRIQQLRSGVVAGIRRRRGVD